MADSEVKTDSFDDRIAAAKLEVGNLIRIRDALQSKVFRMSEEIGKAYSDLAHLKILQEVYNDQDAQAACESRGL